jgi:hypothetical protein
MLHLLFSRKMIPPLSLISAPSTLRILRLNFQLVLEVWKYHELEVKERAVLFLTIPLLHGMLIKLGPGKHVLDSVEPKSMSLIVLY